MPLSTSKSKVCFFFQGVKPWLPYRTKLKKYILTLLKTEGKNLEFLNYVFCSDKALLEINRQYLSHDFYTDIITFDLSESESVQAEIYISIERVKENALQLEVSFQSELHRVIFHGALHLCGYKDKTKEEKTAMRIKEEFHLGKYLN